MLAGKLSWKIEMILCYLVENTLHFALNNSVKLFAPSKKFLKKNSLGYIKLAWVCPSILKIEKKYSLTEKTVKYYC